MNEESEKLKYLRTTVFSYKQELDKMRRERKVLVGRIAALEALLKSAETLLKRELKKSGVSLKAVPETVKSGKYAGMTLKQAIYAVLTEAKKAMHVKEILQQLREGGAELKAKEPKMSIASTLIRGKERYEKVAPNTFQLRREGLDSTQAPLLKD